ncbi:hemolysin family protein [Millionella massiliensis]|uniref:hemolysin family protein n=1 Tax=Millionella massiliensis TaxID=1871023 RepID=UPI0024B751C7|nr:hemolysin family protein [Millionella massiliensis]
MEIVIIVLLLLLNGVFAMYEFSLVSSSRARLKNEAARGSRKAEKTLRLLDEPEKILSTIQIGITLIGIVSGAFGGVSLADDVKPLFEKISFLAPYANDLAMITVVALITYLSLIIGELVPKSIALGNPERVATLLTPIMIGLTKISYPFVWLLSISTKVVNRLLGIKSGDERSMTEDEIKMIIRQSTEQGILEKEETEMLQDVFRFTDKHANELMTHRKDLVYLFTRQSREEVLETIATAHYSRYLLCGDSTSDIVGMVSVKDIIDLWRDGKTFDLRSIATEPLLVPENLQATRVLKLFKQHKCSFAAVISEYGMIEGVITLHDLAESILGEVPDENDTAEPAYIKRNDGSILVDGTYSVDDFMEEMGIVAIDDLQKEDFNTLSGLAMFMLGRIPTEGDQFDYRNLHFEVVDMDASRVDKLLVTVKPE